MYNREGQNRMVYTSEGNSSTEADGIPLWLIFLHRHAIFVTVRLKRKNNVCGLERYETISNHFTVQPQYFMRYMRNCGA